MYIITESWQEITRRKSSKNEMMMLMSLIHLFVLLMTVMMVRMMMMMMRTMRTMTRMMMPMVYVFASIVLSYNSCSLFVFKCLTCPFIIEMSTQVHVYYKAETRTEIEVQNGNMILGRHRFS